MNADPILNALLDALLPEINDSLPTALKAGGFDTWKKVCSGSCSAGKVNLGLCKATAKASYSITDMKELSSIEILTVKVNTSSGPATGGRWTGTMTMDAKLNKNLSAKVEGKVKASCGGLSDSAKIKGKVTGKGIKFTAKGPFEATLGTTDSCLQSLKIDTLKLDYSSIDVKIDGLGIFNSMLKPIEDAVFTLFKDALNKEIAGAVKPELNKVIKAEMPYCIGITTLAVSGEGVAAG